MRGQAFTQLQILSRQNALNWIDSHDIGISKFITIAHPYFASRVYGVSNGASFFVDNKRGGDLLPTSHHQHISS